MCWNCCAWDYGAQCFVQCTLCTQQMRSTLTTFAIFWDIESFVDRVWGYDQELETNKCCKFALKNVPEMYRWNKHLRLRSTQRKRTFAISCSGYSPRPVRRGFIFTSVSVYRMLSAMSHTSNLWAMSIKCGFAFSWGVPLTALLYVPSTSATFMYVL